MSFGQRIKDIRTAKDIGPTEFATRVGVSKTTLWSWENGTATTINGDNLIAVSRALGVTPEFIMTGKQSNMDITAEDQELVTLYHELTMPEREHVLGLLRAIANTRTVPRPPEFDYGED